MNAAQSPDASLSFDVTEADFRQTVLERSLDVPVLVDCWAPWCGPCRNLKPVLEKLVRDYGGSFVLAKLNTDEAPQISAALQIRSIPLVVLFIGGKPVDQFMGALPESQVRAFLDKHIGEQVSEAEAMRQAAATEVDPAEAEALLRDALSLEPGHTEAALDLSARLIDRGAFDEAARLLEAMTPGQRNERHAALLKRIQLAKNKPAGDPAELAARIAANAKDFEARFALAALQAHAGDFNAAFDQLLEVVMRDRAEWREKARLQLVEWFALCTDAQAVSRGRRYLGMYLN
jgi:putative thioredoxin